MRRDLILISIQHDLFPSGSSPLLRNFNVFYFSKISEAIFSIHESLPELLVIDIDEQESAAFEFISELKSDAVTKSIKVVAISSSTDHKKEIESFRVGADDFVLKPLHPDSFLARINARTENVKNNSVNLQNNKPKLKIDLESFAVYVDDKIINLSRKEFELLYLLASRPGKAFTRLEIFDKVWKREADEKDRTIDVHVLRLRRKLKADFITTQKGVGYRLIM